MLGITRRTIPIPLVINGENILALIEVGGRVFNKEMIYRKFFEHGLEHVKEEIIAEIKKGGGTEKDFNAMMQKMKPAKSK